MQNGLVEIRPHHLLCLFLFVRYGYSDDFIRNLFAITKKLNDGAPILVVSGRDDICRGLNLVECPHEISGACKGHVMQTRDMKALEELNRYVFVARPLQAGRIVKPTLNEKIALRENFALGTIRGACKNCESWYDTCTEIADGGYVGTELYNYINGLLGKPRSSQPVLVNRFG